MFLLLHLGQAEPSHRSRRCAAEENKAGVMSFIMKMQVNGETLNISGVKSLGIADSDQFRTQARAALTPTQKNIDIDLSETSHLDSFGLGTLIALHKTTSSRHGAVRLLNPNPSVQQILELTRMHRIFKIVKP